MIYWEKQKKIKSLFELYTKPVRTQYGLTQMEISILMFLHRNPEYDTASSIVQTSQFTKSHVSSAIKSLEERNLVTGRHKGSNNKTIHLELTDQSAEILQEATNAGRRYLDCLFSGFSQEELLQMKSYFSRICENAETELQNTEEEKNKA